MKKTARKGECALYSRNIKKQTKVSYSTIWVTSPIAVQDTPFKYLNVKDATEQVNDREIQLHGIYTMAVVSGILPLSEALFEDSNMYSQKLCNSDHF